MNDFIQILHREVSPRHLKWWLIGFVMFVVALLIFHAGVVVGFHAAENRDMGRYDHRPIMTMPFGSFQPPEDFMEDGHGAVGTILSVSGQMLVLKTREGTNININVASSTPVDGPSANLSTMSLKAGQQVVVIGEPEDATTSQIDARLIHILSN